MKTIILPTNEKVGYTTEINTSQVETVFIEIPIGYVIAHNNCILMDSVILYKSAITLVLESGYRWNLTRLIGNVYVSSWIEQ